MECINISQDIRCGKDALNFIVNRNIVFIQ